MLQHFGRMKMVEETPPCEKVLNSLNYISVGNSSQTVGHFEKQKLVNIDHMIFNFVFSNAILLIKV